MADEQQTADLQPQRNGNGAFPNGNDAYTNGNAPVSTANGNGHTTQLNETEDSHVDDAAVDQLLSGIGRGNNRGGNRGGPGRNGGGWRGGGRGPGGGWRGGGGGPGMGGPGGGWRDRDLTNGSIPKNLWGMAWPQATEGVLRVVDQILDLVWAGFLGTPHIAGIGVAQQYTQTAWTARQGIDTAQRAMVSRAVGMGNMALAQLAVFQAATVTAIFWVLIASVGIFFTEPLLHLLAVPDSVIDEAVPYMRLQFMGQGFMGFQQLFAHALMASGDPITPMKAHIVSRVLHGVLSPFFVFGFFFFPELGISGAALAAIIGNSVALGIVARSLFSGHSRLHLKWSEYRIDRRLIWQIVRIGTPAAINGAERSVAQLLIVRFVTPFGENALAAFTLSRRVEMFVNLGSQGFGQASGVIVGQNLGAGKPQRAKQTILWAIGFVMSIKSVLGIVLFFFPEVFLSLFTRDQELLELTAMWVRIQVIGHIAMGSGNVFMQSFMTAGATVYPMLVTLFALWVIELPLAYILSEPLGMGQAGIAWAITIASLSRPFFHVPYFLSGRWMRARVFSQQNMQTAGGPAFQQIDPVMGGG
jgi:putative MATE family efflux protein